MTVSEYEKNQHFNGLVSWLHSLRYRNILQIFSKIAAENGNKPIDVVEVGCGCADLFPTLNEKFRINYTGIDVHAPFIEAARSLYSQHLNFRVILDDAVNALPRISNADVIVALETLEHIPEDKVVRIVEAIAAAKPRYFLSSVPVEIGPAIWLKNVGSWLTRYGRYEEYRWRETFWSGLYQLDKLPPHRGGHAGFDWRWLAQTIRHNMKIVEHRTLPFGVPAPFAFSVFFVAVPRQR